MSKNKPLQKPIAIAVEGADYFYFLLNQLKNNAEFEQVQLFDFGGINQLGRFLRLLRKDRKFRQLKSLGKASFGLLARQFFPSLATLCHYPSNSYPPLLFTIFWRTITAIPT